MKKLKKLFSLIGILSLCIGMTLLNTNKINVNAQELDLDYNDRFWLPIGLFYDSNDNWYFTLNEQDWTETYREVVSPQLGYYTDRGAGSEFVHLYTIFGMYNAEILEPMPDVQTQQAIFNYLGIGPLYNDDIGFKILPLTNIEENLYNNYTFSDNSVDMEQYATSTTFTVTQTPFNHITQLKNMILKQYDLWVLDNPDYSNVYEMGYDDGYDSGYDDGYDEARVRFYDDGYDDGYSLGYDEGYAYGLESDESEAFNNGYNKGLTDSFITGFKDWITPVIAIVIFGGGLFMYFTRKKEM